MNCNNTNCKKSVRNYNYCEDCFLIYCSTTCLNEHKRDLHGFHYSEKNHSTNSNYKSIFIKPGVYEKEIIDDPYFDFSNFDFSNPEKKKRLGSGAFGDVYLAANKIDNKLYAIKVMDKKRLSKAEQLWTSYIERFRFTEKLNMIMLSEFFLILKMMTIST